MRRIIMALCLLAAVRPAFADGNPERLPGLVAELINVKVDAIVTSFDQLTKTAPSEIKSDMNLLNDSLKRARTNVQAGKLPDYGFSSTDQTNLTTAAANVDRFGKDKCGIDFSSNRASMGIPDSDCLVIRS